MVVYSSRFGLEFSGGCIATCKIMEEIQSYFNRIIIISAEIGTHNIKNLDHIFSRNIADTIPILKKMNDSRHIYYGDFFDSIAFVKAGKPFFFTYHDNWPEQKKLSPQDRMNYFYFNSIYEVIFKSALKVFSVSEYKLPFIHQYTNQTNVIRNGILQSYHQKKILNSKKFSILMTGNIDKRKYLHSIPLFDYIREKKSELEIHIFGIIKDQEITEKLKEYPFVKIQGYQQDISYPEYDLYLSTSFIENLSISVVEAIRHNIPVICFNVGGLKEVVHHKKNGLLIPPFDIEKMGSSILECKDKKYKFRFDKKDTEEFDWVISGKKFLKEIGMA